MDSHCAEGEERRMELLERRSSRTHDHHAAVSDARWENSDRRLRFATRSVPTSLRAFRRVGAVVDRSTSVEGNR